MSSIVISGDTSGAVTLTVPATAGTNTVTIPASTGTVMVSSNMPAFSYYASATQAISATTFTKVLFDTKVFDTNNNFASSRFTPTVAGYYQCSWSLSSSIVQGNRFIPMLYKNGAEILRGTDVPTNTWSTTGSGLVYCNGTTDYLEVYIYFGNAANTGGSSVSTFFTGALVRTA